MTEERWAASERLFHDALPLPEPERAAFLDRECAGDAELRREVDSLLAADDHASRHSGLPGDAGPVAAQWIAGLTRGDMVGRRIGPYQLQSVIAYGGMGDVYLADDVTLGRRVALKVLPESFARDPERVRRFTDEARAVSALNHPHIIVIHQIGDAGGRPYLATEYVEGETLRARLARGPLPLAEALDIGLQIASAIEAAHAAGIVHRDLKPENVIVRPDGYVKVLDFGLAKRRGGRSPDSDATQPGAVMGTPAYMSPEQALGQEVDHRTDVFSLGAVLYEMVTGTPPFRGRTDSEMRASLQRGESAQQLQFAQTIGRAIAKDPEQRHQHVTELKHELRTLQRTVDSQLVMAPTPTKSRRMAMAPLAAAIAVVAAIGALSLGWMRSATAVDPPPGVTVTHATDGIGPEYFPSLLPDGQSYLFAAKEQGEWNIYLQRVEGRTPLPLTPNSPGDDTQPAVSPDGMKVAFRSARDGGGVYVMGVTGEVPRRVATFGFNPSWSPDNRSIVVSTEQVERPDGRSTTSELWIIDTATGERRQVVTRDAVQPSWSPDGRFIAFWSIDRGVRDLWLVPAGGGEAVQLTNDPATDWSPAWSTDSRSLFFCSDRGGTMNVWRIAIGDDGRPRGQPGAVTTPAGYTGQLSVARGTGRLAYVNMSPRTAIVRATFDSARGVITTAPAQISPAGRMGAAASVSPDGRRVAFFNEGDPREDIFVVNIDGSNLQRVTDDEFRDRLPRWSPDGTQIAFFSNRGGKYDVWTMRPDGSGLTQITQVPDESANTPIWTPDGARIAVHVSGNTFMVDPRTPWSAQRPQQLGIERFTAVSFSPDGMFLFGWRRTGPSPYPDGISRYDMARRTFELLTDGGHHPKVFDGGRRVMFVSNFGELQQLDLKTGQVTRIDSGGLRIDGVDVAPDGRTLVLTVMPDEADVWLLDWQ